MTRTDKRKQSVYIPEAMRLDGASRMYEFSPGARLVRCPPGRR